MSRRVVIAIDGPAGAGKSTIARTIAHRLGYVYVDTGAMYRSLALWAIRSGIALDDFHKLEQLAIAARIRFVAGASTVLLNGEDVTAAIRDERISEAASKVSIVPAVRRVMADQQRALAEDSSIVMEGRDIGTVIFPDADVKIFLDAAPGERAGRRTHELRQRGNLVAQEAVAREIAERDYRDRTRPEAPLMQAPDAIYLDSTELSIAEAEEAVLRIIRAKISNGKEVAR
jgi:CMP/dCMP kinase